MDVHVFRKAPRSHRYFAGSTIGDENIENMILKEIWVGEPVILLSSTRMASNMEMPSYMGRTYLSWVEGLAIMKQIVMADKAGELHALLKSSRYEGVSNIKMIMSF